MKPPFYKAVDYVFLYVLELIERINSGDTVDSEQERRKIIGLIKDAESKLVQSNYGRDWASAKYAIIAWIDEVLAADLWPENTLEFEFFRTSERWSLFYGGDETDEVRREYGARTALKNHLYDALECYYIAVVLGFRGMYSSPEALDEAKSLLNFDPPMSLDAWAAEISGAIQIANDVPKLSGIPQNLSGAPPHDGKYECLAAWSMAAILAVCAVFLFRWAVR
jgi:type VI secretion system protein ImpK